MSERTRYASRPIRRSLRAQCPVALEALEPRTLLSGNVLVAASGGNLLITGDTSANDIVLSGFMGNVTVASGGSATTINGAAGPTLFAGITKNVTVNLLAGDDALDLNGLHVSGGLTVNMGEDNNTVSVEDGSYDGNVNITGGSGVDTINATGPGIRGSLTIAHGNGVSQVILTDMHVAKGMTVASGAGPSSSLVTSSVTVGGPVTVTVGVGHELQPDLRQCAPGQVAVGHHRRWRLRLPVHQLDAGRRVDGGQRRRNDEHGGGQLFDRGQRGHDDR